MMLARETAGTWYGVRLLAAGLLLAMWEMKGARSARLVRLSTGIPRLRPDRSVEVPGWPVDASEAAEVMVATVMLGARYPGWQRALRVAESEVA